MVRAPGRRRSRKLTLSLLLHHAHVPLDITLSTFKESRNQIRGLECPLTDILARSCLASSVRGHQTSGRFPDDPARFPPLLCTGTHAKGRPLARLFR